MQSINTKRRLRFSGVKYLRNTFLLLGLFTIQNVCLNYYKIYGQALTQDEWLAQIQMYCAGLMIWGCVTYILLLAKSFGMIQCKFDGLETSLLLVFLLSSFVDVLDSIYNGNWRSTNLDWWVFGISIFVIISLKVIKHTRWSE